MMRYRLWTLMMLLTLGSAALAAILGLWRFVQEIGTLVH